MINKLIERAKDERGFTLIELMVVVLIIAILIAIAIPTFLGARERAQERAAQSSLRNTVTAAKTIFTDEEDYADADVTALEAAEPSLVFVAATVDSDDPNQVSVSSSQVGAATSGNNRFFASVRSNSGNCWFIQDIVGPAGTANAGTTWSRDLAAANDACQAQDAPAFDSGNWESEPGDVDTDNA